MIITRSFIKKGDYNRNVINGNLSGYYTVSYEQISECPNCHYSITPDFIFDIYINEEIVH